MNLSSKIGILGGGQLAKMLALSAYPLGCSVHVFSDQAECPAASVTPFFVQGELSDRTLLKPFLSSVDVVTLENEFIDIEALKWIESQGVAVFPSSQAMLLIQDKFLQKQCLKNAGLSVTECRAVSTQEDILAAASEWNWPLVLKARRNAYDGKGNMTVYSAKELPKAWAAFQAQPLFVEKFCPFEQELAVIVTRGQDGKTVVYPVVESIQKDHVCQTVIAPATVSLEVREKAIEIALKTSKMLEYVGTMGIELFLTKDNRILVNELAPRVHNTGHYTIEASVCSQFENHIRAILGLPLGATDLITPAAVMINLLGKAQGSGVVQGLKKALSIDGAHVHIYGKKTVSKGRKMGHVTVLDDTVSSALNKAESAEKLLYFGDNA